MEEWLVENEALSPFYSSFFSNWDEHEIWPFYVRTFSSSWASHKFLEFLPSPRKMSVLNVCAQLIIPAAKVRNFQMNNPNDRFLFSDQLHEKKKTNAYHSFTVQCLPFLAIFVPRVFCTAFILWFLKLKSQISLLMCVIWLELIFHRIENQVNINTYFSQ